MRTLYTCIRALTLWPVTLAIVLLALSVGLSSCAVPGGAQTKPDPIRPDPPAASRPQEPSKTAPREPGSKETPLPAERPVRQAHIDAAGKTVQARFTLPDGFERPALAADSFGHYLRMLPLKPDGTLVRHFDGSTKINRDIYVGVIDIDVGDRDLQQCADAVMRLRSEYLYAQKRYAEIGFSFANGFRADYSKWAEGYRIVVEGNNARWVKSAGASTNYRDFRKYLDMVFAYANTVSMARSMSPVRASDMTVGDVFVDQGHALIVIDMAFNKSANKKLFLIAQSYMPAQDIQVLKNPRNPSLSPWYELDFGTTLETPEWTFTSSDLKRFR